jgi:hypothetical protein
MRRSEKLGQKVSYVPVETNLLIIKVAKSLEHLQVVPPRVLVKSGRRTRTATYWSTGLTKAQSKLSRRHSSSCRNFSACAFSVTRCQNGHLVG